MDRDLDLEDQQPTGLLLTTSLQSCQPWLVANARDAGPRANARRQALEEMMEEQRQAHEAARPVSPPRILRNPNPHQRPDPPVTVETVNTPEATVVPPTQFQTPIVMFPGRTPSDITPDPNQLGLKDADALRGLAEELLNVMQYTIFHLRDC